MSTVNEKLKVLQTQADLLGLTYHHRTGVDKLQAQIGAYLVENPAKAGLLLSEGSLETPAPVVEEIVKVEPNLDYIPLSAVEYKVKSQKLAGIQIGALRRIQYTNMNPNKKEWKGEVISVGSAKRGTFKKFIPFGGKPYHVPQIIYDVMKERQCSVFYTESDQLGGDIRKSHLINEYAIVDLPPLTAAELKDLATKQALASTGL